MKLHFVVWILIFAMLDLALGRFSQWWTVVIPAIVIASFAKDRVILPAVIGAIIAWFGMGLFFDIPTGMRLSSRIAGIVGLHGWALSYLIIGVLVSAIVALGSYAGENLRIAIKLAD